MLLLLLLLLLVRGVLHRYMVPAGLIRLIRRPPHVVPDILRWPGCGRRRRRNHHLSLSLSLPLHRRALNPDLSLRPLDLRARRGRDERRRRPRGAHRRRPARVAVPRPVVRAAPLRRAVRVLFIIHHRWVRVYRRHPQPSTVGRRRLDQAPAALAHGEQPAARVAQPPTPAPRLAHPYILPDPDLDPLVREGACEGGGFCVRVSFGWWELVGIP
ncbi:hypothetical protein B0H11DRAFT_2082910 [Mycena galericulata]|nr:hypothetical protein B0H11DRAFT_2082910 [Mycena galericulata]